MTTAVMTIADFILDRVSEDEKIAGRCCITDQPWIGFVDYRGAHYMGLSCARILADVRAKRKIVRLHAACGTGTGCCDDGRGGAEGVGCTTLAYLALPYADHRDYDEAWRP